MRISSCSILLPHTRKGLFSRTAHLSSSTRDCPGQGPPRPNSQLSPASTHGLSGFITSSLFPSLQLQATRSLSLLLKPCLAGEGAINPALSQEFCSRPGGFWAWGCSVSYLHICCGTVGCSLCSTVDQVGVSPMCREKWTPLPPISLPCSLIKFLIMKNLKCYSWKQTI